MINMGSKRPKTGGNWLLLGPYLQRYLHNHGLCEKFQCLNFKYTEVNCILVSACLYGWSKTQMCPKSISKVGLFLGIVCDFERLKGGNLVEPWITGEFKLGGDLKEGTSDFPSYHVISLQQLGFSQKFWGSFFFSVIFNNYHMLGIT